ESVFFSSRRRHTSSKRDWSSDVCSSDLMASYEEQEAKIERYDKRIEEIAAEARYQENVKKLVCFLGIRTHTALSLIVETGDFKQIGRASCREGRWGGAG